jgi:hypothetical protein
MPTSSDWRRLQGLAVLLCVVALGELVLLRVGTRTLIHIPGLGRYEAQISSLAELGRFFYYLAVVCLMATLILLAYRSLRIRTPRLVAIGIGLLGFLAAAGAGRFGVVPAPIVGWLSVAALMVVCTASSGGLRRIPIAFFVAGWVAAAWTVLGQGAGGGLSGRQVDGFMLVAEISLILSAITVPLLLKGPPPRLAILAGIGATIVSAGAFVSGSSTLSILVLWNLGVPGWLPGLAYSVAFGSLVATLWAASSSGQKSTVIGLVLLVAGGIGTISTYQTGLVLTAVLLLGSTVLTTDPGSTEPIRGIRTGESQRVTTRPSMTPGASKTPTAVG